MAKLGSPVTREFNIGTAEFRVGPLTAAGRLTQGNSVGLVDSGTLSVEQTSVDLEGGFPQQIVDTSVVKQAATATAVLREYSRRNLKLMLGEGVETTAPSTTASLVTTDIAALGATFDVSAGEGANFADGDVVVIYVDNRPETVTIGRVDSIATDTVTLENGIPEAIAGTTETVNVYVVNPIAIGGITKTNYFSMSMLQADTGTGKPKGFEFWKTALGGSMTYTTNATDYASNDLELKILQPAADEYGIGGDLAHLSAEIQANPTGRYFGIN